MDLTSVPKSIDDALRVQRKYVIPRFQREYAWENEELQTIYEDLMIGNLLPLGEQLNNDLSNKNFKSKMTRYPESQYTTVKKFVEENKDKEEWGEKEIVERTKCIAEIMYHSIIEG